MPQQCPPIPSLSYPNPLYIVAGKSTTFDLGLTDASEAPADVMFYTYNDNLTATPDTVDLTSKHLVQSVTIAAAANAVTMTEAFDVDLYIPGAIAGVSPTMRVIVTP